MPDTAEEKIVRDFFATLSEGDYDRLRTMLHPEATWEVMSKAIPGAGIHRGRAGIIDEFLGPVRGLFRPGDPKVRIKRMFSKDGFVSAETEAVGKLSDGRDYHNHYCWSIEVKDGTVLVLREYMDTAYIVALFG